MKHVVYKIQPAGADDSNEEFLTFGKSFSENQKEQKVYMSAASAWKVAEKIEGEVIEFQLVNRKVVIKDLLENL